jgi:hypothetical protein
VCVTGEIQVSATCAAFRILRVKTFIDKVNDTLVPMKKASQSKMYSMRLEIALINALQKIKARDGIPVTEQVKRAIKTWIKKKGVKA